jgi:hypothetical protein
MVIPILSCHGRMRRVCVDLLVHAHSERVQNSRTLFQQTASSPKSRDANKACGILDSAPTTHSR